MTVYHKNPVYRYPNTSIPFHGFWNQSPLLLYRCNECWDYKEDKDFPVIKGYMGKLDRSKVCRICINLNAKQKYYRDKKSKYKGGYKVKKTIKATRK